MYKIPLDKSKVIQINKKIDQCNEKIKRLKATILQNSSYAKNNTIFKKKM